MSKRSNYVFRSLYSIIFCGLLVQTAVAFEYGSSPNATIDFDSNLAGNSPTHRFSVDVVKDELETYRLELRYPDDFRFNGFDVLGPPGTPVGSYTIDIDFDGTPDQTVTLFSLNRREAYVDVLPDGQFSSNSEPILENTGGSRFLLRLPFGGDASHDTLFAPFDTRLSFVLQSGLLTNPDKGGVYTVEAKFTSVDPDTDDADDGRGFSPQSFSESHEVSIVHAPLPDFTIRKAQYKLKKGPHDRFKVFGRFHSANQSIDLTNETVTVAFATFSQRIPGRYFVPSEEDDEELEQNDDEGDDHVAGVQFRDKGPGVTRLNLSDDGRFRIEARNVVLKSIEPHQPVNFVLQFGDQRGEMAITFDRSGHCRRERHHRRCTP